MTVRIELHKVDPYKIWWVGEKKFTHRGQEETFLRFTIDPDGKQVGDYTYEEKKFVIPIGNTLNPMAPDNIEDDGASTFEDERR